MSIQLNIKQEENSEEEAQSQQSWLLIVLDLQNRLSNVEVIVTELQQEVEQLKSQNSTLKKEIVEQRTLPMAKRMWGTECHFCGEDGHWASKCPLKSQRALSNEGSVECQGFKSPVVSFMNKSSQQKAKSEKKKPKKNSNCSMDNIGQEQE